MGVRTITNWTATGVNNEYKKIIPDLEARIRLVTEDSSNLSEGSGIGVLSAGQYYFDEANNALYVRATDSGDVNSKTMLIYIYFLAFGTWATQAEMSNNELFQTYEPQENYYIEYIKIWIMKKGNPTFTDMKLEIHPELSNYPTAKILTTSENTWTNSTINSFSNAASEIWFRFDNFYAKANEKYCLVLKATGTFSDSVHVSWLKFEPVYQDGLTIDMNLMEEGPFRYSIIGRDA